VKKLKPKSLSLSLFPRCFLTVPFLCLVLLFPHGGAFAEVDSKRLFLGIDRLSNNLDDFSQEMNDLDLKLRMLEIQSFGKPYGRPLRSKRKYFVEESTAQPSPTRQSWNVTGRREWSRPSGNQYPKTGGTPRFSPSPEVIPQNAPQYFPQYGRAISDPDPGRTNSETQVIETSKAPLGRAYVLPFVSLAKPSKMEWSFASTTTSLREEAGWGGGLRFGYDFGNAFIELQGMSYRNRFSGQIAPGVGLIPLPVSGDVSGLGFTANVGGRVFVSDKIHLLVGGGLGVVRQSVQLNITVFTIPEEESWELSYQLFFGGGYVFNEHIELQLLYRWYTTHEMSSFSRRSMHLGEIALGYVF
jgi:hypothetical protein